MTRVLIVEDNEMNRDMLSRRLKRRGFEVEMANHLARDLGVELDFVPVTLENMGALLGGDTIDIVMSSIAATPARMSRLGLSNAYMDVTLALVVRQEDTKKFSDASQLHRLPPMKVAVPTTDEAISA